MTPDEWRIRVTAVLSLCAHVGLVLFASVRRHQRSGFRRVILWAAYQAADWAAPFLLNKLSSLDSASTDQQLVAFWLPFVLMHLGGPDNMTAYSFDDNKLSLRQVAKTILSLLGNWSAIYVQYNVVTSKGADALYCASSIMMLVGILKYAEKASALQEADFGNIRSAGNKQKKKKTERNLRIRSHGRHEQLSNEEALLLAHELLPITKAAFADYSVHDDRLLRAHANLRQIFSVVGQDDEDHCCNRNGWDNMCKVVEMELSLMYDILYTKATKVHSWVGIGYLIRIVSPVATGTMMTLFWFESKGSLRAADVAFTYALLGVSFILEVRWLLRAVASTWTYASFNNAMPACCHCLRHLVICSGRWHRLRHAIVSLDPRWLLCREPAVRDSSYRLWSGTIGQYNLFDECTHDSDKATDLCRSVVTLFVSEETWIEYKNSRRCKLGKPCNCNNKSGSMRELLFAEIHKMLKKAHPRDKMVKEEEVKVMAVFKEEEAKKMPMPQMLMPPIDQRRHRLDEALSFAPEFQEVILILHVATDVILETSQCQFSETEKTYKKAIEAMSNYMIFLAAARPDMLPGLKFRTQYNGTREKLCGIRKDKCGGSSSKCRLACSLRHMAFPSNLEPRNELREESPVLWEGVIIAAMLLQLLSPQNYADEERGYYDSCCLAEEDDEADSKWWGIIEERIGCIITYSENGTDSYSKRKKRILLLFRFLFPDLVETWRGQGFLAEQLLKHVLGCWVRLLLNVSTRCSADSHAKQLGRGCELTTIVWILNEHASIFGL